MKNTTAGLVLCGGASRRMGEPKAWLRYRDEYLLQRVVRLLRGDVCDIVIAAAEGQALPPLPDGIEIVSDPVAGQGPLQGLASGLSALAGRAECVYVTGCDTPLLRPGWVNALVQCLGDAQVCVPHAEGRLHPLAAVYRCDIMPVVSEQLTAGRFRLLDLLDRLRVRTVSADELRMIDPDLASLRNANTPEGFSALLAGGAECEP